MVCIMTVEIAPETENLMTYDDALLYCQFLEYDGYRDWRMPTEEEWINLDHIQLMSWWRDDVNIKNDGIFLSVVPVRDVCLK